LKILDSFGRIGKGPGEFFGKRWPVYLSLGLDGMLYARDAMAFKVMKFSRDFKFIREYRYHQYGNNMQGAMEVDANGNIYFYKVKDNKLICRNQDEKILLQIPINDMDVGSLFYKKPKEFSKTECILLSAAHHPVLLVFFQDTSMLFVVKDNKVIKKMKLWPRDALADYKIKLKKTIERSKSMYISLFSRLFIDWDDKNIFYLQYGKNETKGINTLYKFTINGELQEVLFVHNQMPHIKFLLKQDNKFFARSGEKILVYKEGKK
jgi:hypothetical protein